MRNILACFILLSLVASCRNNGNHSPRNRTEARIYRSVDSMLAAFKRNDFTTFVKYHNPGMVKMMGGEASFASFISEQMRQIPDTTIKKIEAGKILQVVRTNRDYQCIVEQITEIHTEGTKILSTTYLVGESVDGGKWWTFFDASTSARAPKEIKPNLSPKLKIPQKKREMEKL
jgi:uncharacterized protein YlzI (FlbEa/FlbD family)